MRTGLFVSLILALPMAARAQTPAVPTLSHNQFSDWFFHHNAGWQALRLNKLDKAAYCFGKAIDVARLELETDPRLMARSYGDLAWVLHRQGRDAEAEPLAQWALAVREKAFVPEKMPVAQTLYTLAAIEMKLDKIDEAEVNLKRTLSICEKNLGSKAPGTADAIDDLAVVYMTRRQYDKARALYQRALGIFLSISGDHPGQVMPLDGLATIELAEGKLPEAEAHLNRVVTLIGQGAPFDAESTARIFSRQAEIYRKTNRPEMATQVEASAKSIPALSRPKRPLMDWSSPSRRRPGDP